MAEQTEQLLVETKIYLKSGIHIGTKFKSKHMEQFIYKTRPDGLSVLNLQKIDERIGLLAKFLAQHEPEDIVVVSRRENGWKPAKLFGELAGIRVFAERYPPGILTNPKLDIFTEAKVLLSTDAWPDRNAINDAMQIGIPVAALCDTNNMANNIDLIIPCNNKGKKSLGLLFYILTKEFMKLKGMIKNDSEMKYGPDDFAEE